MGAYSSRYAQCQGTGGRAFPEYSEKVPLTPDMDGEKHMEVYQFGNQPKSDAATKGAPTYNEKLDAQNHHAKNFPWAQDRRVFHADKPEPDRINQTYENMLGDDMNINGTAKPNFSTQWEKDLAYHHGLYVPEVHQEARSVDDIRIAVSEFADKVQQDDPDCACKYLKIEEFRCLQVHQVHAQPQVAARKCAKWWDETQKCMWDQEKMRSGYTHVEGPQMQRRRAYLFYPDYKYA